MLLFQADELRHFARASLVAARTEPAQAAILVDHLINANLTGHDSHGVLRGSRDRRDCRRARWTFGQISALFAAELAPRVQRSAVCVW